MLPDKQEERASRRSSLICGITRVMNSKSTLFSVVAVALASALIVPTAAHAKRLGGGFKARSAITSKAPARSTPAPVATPTPTVTPKGPSLMGTVAATAAGAAVGSVAGNAIAGAVSNGHPTPEQKAAAEAKAKTDAEVATLQKQLDEAKARQAAGR